MQLIKDGEMFKIKDKVRYDFDQDKWKVPPFFIKKKEVNFPKIKDALGFVLEELKKREIVLDNGKSLESGANGDFLNPEG